MTQADAPMGTPAAHDLRPATQVAFAEVLSFFEQLGEGDRTFLKVDTAAEPVARAWSGNSEDIRLVACGNQGEVCGAAAVHPGSGWSRHVGQVTVAVRPDRRGQGFGGALARAAMQHAYACGLLKLTVEVDAEETSVIHLFKGLGFAPEALLEGHVRDTSGRLSDLLIMSQHGPDNAELFAVVGLTEGLA